MLFISVYLLIAVLLTQFIAAYFFSKSRTNYRKAFSAMILCVSVYLFGYLMIINTNNLDGLIFWNQFQYLGLPFASALWLTVALLYTKTIYSLKNKIIILLFSIPVITFFIRLTNFWHHLFYTKLELRYIFGHYSLYTERGIWYYVNISYSMLCLLLTVIIYISGYLRNQAGYTKSHFLVFFLASLLPLIGTVLVVFVYMEQTIDFAALITPISLIIISFGIIKYDFLDIKTLARDTVFETNQTGMVILGPGYRIIDYNKAASKFFKELNISLASYPIEHILNREPELLEIFKSKTSRDYSLAVNGEKRFFEIDTVLLGNPQDGQTKMLKTIRDITEKRKIHEKMRILATIDSLSGLYNRAEFMNLAQLELAHAKKHNEELSLLMMDMDCFKSINDTFGHAAGDEAIREMGKIIMSRFRKTDIAGRIGGEEFAVILKNAPLAEAKTAAEQFREIVAGKRVIYRNQEIKFTVSIGVAATGGGTDYIRNIEDFLKIADDAMYKAKAMGRNCVVASEPGKEVIISTEEGHCTPRIEETIEKPCIEYLKDSVCLNNPDMPQFNEN